MGTEQVERSADQDRADLHLLFNAVVTELAFFKSQQWSVANYGLLGLAALVGSLQLGKWQECWIRCAFAAAGVCLVAAAEFMLWFLEDSIRVRRRRLRKAREGLTKAYKDAWAAGDKPPWHDWPLTMIFLTLALAIGFVIFLAIVMSGRL